MSATGDWSVHLSAWRERAYYVIGTVYECASSQARELSVLSTCAYARVHEWYACTSALLCTRQIIMFV